MTFNWGGFDAAKVEPDSGFDPLPVGNYRVVISDTAEKVNSAGTGSYVRLTFDVVAGQYMGRKLWENLNLQNPNKQAVDIAMSQLSAICRAIGVLTPRDHVQLRNIPLDVLVGLSKRKDTGEPQNTIKKYARKGELTQPAATVQGVPPQGDMQTHANDVPPWQQ